MFKSVGLAVSVVLCLAACTAAPMIDPGEAVYSQPLVDGNTFTCSTCHALSEPAGDGFRRPGHPIGDATRRPTYKNGQTSSMLDAVNTCVTEWMGATAFAPDDRRYLDLFDWLDAQAPAGDAPALAFEVVDTPSSTGGGDALAGQTLFNASCAICHDQNASGSQLAPSLAVTELEADYMVRRVRTSGDPLSPTYQDLTGGRMPFWSVDRLSDDEVRDLVAFLQELQTGQISTGGTIGELGDCPTTHARIGWQAELSTFAHSVSGTATIVNDCSIQITGFSFDGGGIDVRAYGAVGGDYDNGFGMGGDLTRPEAYENVTLNLQLPANRTLDDLDGVSIWCVPVGVSFGDGLFGPP